MNAPPRRDVLKIGALLAVPAARHTSVVRFGASRDAWPAFHHAIPYASGTRIYCNRVNQIPVPWPSPHAAALVSIRPWPPDLLGGRLDRRLRHMARHAPPGSMLTPWYEAGPSNPRGYDKAITATAVQHCQRYLRHFLRHTNIAVGSLIAGPAADLAEWIAPGLDWYGDDIDGEWFRQGGQWRTSYFQRRQARNHAEWQRKARTRHPRVVVGETNIHDDQLRPEWFTMLAANMATRGGGRILTFWAEPGRARQGHGTGPWPPSARTILTLRNLAAYYGHHGMKLW